MRIQESRVWRRQADRAVSSERTWVILLIPGSKRLDRARACPGRLGLIRIPQRNNWKSQIVQRWRHHAILQVAVKHPQCYESGSCSPPAERTAAQRASE